MISDTPPNKGDNDRQRAACPDVVANHESRADRNSKYTGEQHKRRTSYQRIDGIDHCSPVRHHRQPDDEAINADEPAEENRECRHRSYLAVPLLYGYYI